MIEFEHVGKSVGGTVVLSEVNLQIPDGELVVIAGPSGCGKTTTLKMINRLIAPSTGRVLIDVEILPGSLCKRCDEALGMSPSTPVCLSIRPFARI